MGGDTKNSNISDGLDLLRLGKKGYDLWGTFSSAGGSSAAAIAEADLTMGMSGLGASTGSMSAAAIAEADLTVGMSGVGTAAEGGLGGGLGAGLGAGAFVALAAFMAAKIYDGMTADRPALTFQGGKKPSMIPVTKGGGRNGVSTDEIQMSGDPRYVSDKFNFSIGGRDLPDGSTYAADVGEYFDETFTLMQENTDVDIDKLIEHGFDLTDWDAGGVEEMIKGVVDKVTSGIQTGKPLSPFYSRNRSLENTKYADELDERRYVTGREKVDAEGNPFVKIKGREGANQQEYWKATYATIDDIEGDAGFVMPTETNTGQEGNTTTGQEGDVTTDNDLIDQDLMNTLSADLGMSVSGSSQPIKFQVGNQTVSVMPRDQRDQMGMMLQYLQLKQNKDLTEQELAYKQRALEAGISADEPSTINKTSQVLGTASDLIGLWDDVSSLWG